MSNALYYGDNLAVLRTEIADASVDLIYLDPPFNSNATYNVLFRAPGGASSESQIEAFEDTWHWGEVAERAFLDVVQSRSTNAAMMLTAMRRSLGENDMMAYLAMMAVRLIELHRVLRPTGSLYLHCDPTASHYLKVVLDSVFGAENFRNEVIWKRTSSANNPNRWGPVHDTLLFASKSERYLWNRTTIPLDPAYQRVKYKNVDERGIYRLSDLTAAGIRTGDSGKPWRGFDPAATGRHWAVPRSVLLELGLNIFGTQQKLDAIDAAGFVYWTPGRGGKPGFPQFKRYLNDGQPVQDVIEDIPPINSQAKERLGYPTQKPLALLERIIAASSNPGDVVLDPFCGCGTAVHAAEKLGRRWIGIDITHLAISLIERRLKDAFPAIAFTVHGTPKDLAGARDLAARDKYQFQWWAVSLVDAVPQGGKKKGMDRGIDGVRFIQTGPRPGEVERVLVSVKGGESVSSQMVRDLRGVIEREGAVAGLFLTLAEPTREMLREAATAGFVDTIPFAQAPFPRLQILTIGELLAGLRPDLPSLGRHEGFKRAPLERGDRGTQGEML